MPQIFTASADTRLRVAVFLLGTGVVGALLFGGGYVNSAYVTRVGWTRHQPVPFSHKHHVGDDGIDCRYCHDKVEVSSEAGLPSTHTCMTCHSQLYTGAPVLAPVRQSFATGEPIRWNRVAKVPDYVFFNHAIHISRGVPCVTCHGRVDQMALTFRAEPFQMQWCLDCHRNPEPHLRPPEMVTRMDWSDWDPDAHKDFGRLAVKAYGIDPKRLDACTVCHR